MSRLSLALIGAILFVAFMTILISLHGEIGLAVVRGRSMEPTLHSGDLVILRPADELMVGDVIVYFNGRRKIHRIVGTTPKGCYWTKGDWNLARDRLPVCDPEWKVVWLIRLEILR